MIKILKEYYCVVYAIKGKRTVRRRRFHPDQIIKDGYLSECNGEYCTITFSKKTRQVRMVRSAVQIMAPPKKVKREKKVAV